MRGCGYLILCVANGMFGMEWNGMNVDIPYSYSYSKQ
jgi:hypothetical protein